MLLLDVVDTASDWGYLLTAFSLGNSFNSSGIIFLILLSLFLFLVCYSGYFIYDTVEMAAYLKKKGTAELLLHHFFVCNCTIVINY